MEQTNMTAVDAPQQSVKGLSFRGIWQVFYQPSVFFEQLKHNPRVLIPWLVIFVVFFFVTVITADIAERDRMELMRDSPLLQGQDLTAQPSTAKTIIGAFVGALFYAFLPALVVSAIAMLVGNFMMAGKASFKQILSVVLYGGIIGVAGELVKVPLILMKGSSFVSLSFAALFPSLEVTSPVYVFLAAFSFFSIWEMIALGIGFAAIYQFTRNKGYIISVISVGTVLVIGSLIAIFFMSFIT